MSIDYFECASIVKSLILLIMGAFGVVWLLLSAMRSIQNEFFSKRKEGGKEDNLDGKRDLLLRCILSKQARLAEAKRSARVSHYGTFSTMKLPGGDNAIVDREKLAGYCLNPAHPRGKHKARVFKTALGFTANNADELRAALLTAAANNDAVPSTSDRFGERYVIDFEISGLRGTGTVRSAWIVRSGESVPRLTSCYVK